MDNNFSAQVKEIISYSREEALRLGNDFIGTEHIVLGLIRDNDNTAIKLLKALHNIYNSIIFTLKLPSPCKKLFPHSFAPY